MIIDTFKSVFKGTQLNCNTFYLNKCYYRGRIEEARKKYNNHYEIFTKYSFEDYVNLNYKNIKKPRKVIIQELIDIFSEHLEPSKMVKALSLINQL